MNRQVIPVVDDEAPMRTYISANLKVRGYDVVTAADGSEALKLIDERPFDLLILDIMMPGPDGLAVLARVRRDMDVPVLMLSARGRERDKAEALDAGADDYLRSRSASRSYWRGCGQRSAARVRRRRARCRPIDAGILK